jgi:choline dehydrogenase-like flavoprotein
MMPAGRTSSSHRPSRCDRVIEPYRLRAISNLRVADASVMPTIPRANINLTCIMIGEHVAGRMRAGQ